MALKDIEGLDLLFCRKTPHLKFNKKTYIPKIVCSGLEELSVTGEQVENAGLAPHNPLMPNRVFPGHLERY